MLLKKKAVPHPKFASRYTCACWHVVAGLQRCDDVRLIKDCVAIPIPFGPCRRPARHVLGALQDRYDVQLVETLVPLASPGCD